MAASPQVPAPLPLAGKTAVVTGGVKGIGAAITARLVGQGANVVVIDRDRPGSPLEDVDYVQADIGSYGAVSAALADAVAKGGPLDIVVNNAGWDKVQPFIDNDPELWETLVRINLIGLFNVTHAALLIMRERGGGRIINIASDAGRVGSSGEAAYSACKGGAIAFTKSIAREAARWGVLVNAVCPGPTDTPLMAEMRSDPSVDKLMEAIVRATPLRKLAQPDDVAAAVLYFAMEPGHVTGQALSVSGGLTMAD
jgi:2-hydroxycyclohexanecarboxyl-CoA dehydrogenase